MDNLLRFSAPIELQAAGGDQKRPTFRLVAYDGKPMRVSGFGSVIVDLTGADVLGSIPLLESHGENLDNIVGQGTAKIESNQIIVTGSLTDATPSGQKVLALARSGISLQASIGYAPEKREYVRAGDTVRVNGGTFIAPADGLSIVRVGRLREVSLVPVGAAGETQVQISAKADSQKGNQNMADENNNTDSIQAERDRTAEINAKCDTRLAGIAGQFVPDRVKAIRASAVTEGWTEEKTENELLRCERDAYALRDIRGQRQTAPELHGSSRDIDPIQCAAAGLMIRAGFSKAAERQFGEPMLHAADAMRKGTLLDLCETCLRAEGIEKPQGREAMVKAAFSTVIMPQTLGLAGEKILLDAFREAPSPWREWCKIVSVQSFREHTLLRPSFLGGFEQLGPAGEIKHGHVGEETAMIRADTYAKLLRIDRQSIVNDDAGAFGQAAQAMGKAAARKLNDLVIQVLLAGSASFFTEARGNLLDDPLSVSAVAAAIAVLRAQVDADGGNLDIMPRVLAVGPALESLAIAICNSDFVGVTDGSPTGNSLKGLLIPVVEPRLANATLGGSATTWAVLAAPIDSPQAVAFLNGQETPTVESLGLDADVDHLSYGWRAYFDFGSALVDWRSGVLSTGDGGA
jgi:hypothetical protein